VMLRLRQNLRPVLSSRWPKIARSDRRASTVPHIICGKVLVVVKTTIDLRDDLHQALQLAAKERGTSEVELIRTAVRHEVFGARPGQAERGQRCARLLAALGTLDSSVYPAGYLDALRAGRGG
jgi:hypothetical protein